MAQYLIWITLLLSPFTSQAFIPGEIEKIITDNRLQKFEIDRNNDSTNDVVIKGDGIYYDNNFDGHFEVKIIFKPNKKMILFDNNKDNIFELKKELNYKNQNYSIYHIENNNEELIKKYAPIYPTTANFTNQFNVTKYKNGKLIETTNFKSELYSGNLLGWLLIREANPLPTYSPNHFNHQLEQCYKYNSNFCIDPSVCTSGELPFGLPMEIRYSINPSFHYSWCENNKSELSDSDRQYDFNRDVTRFTSTGLKMTESCPGNRQQEIEKSVMIAYGNLFNCFKPGSGRFPNEKRYQGIRQSFGHLINNGGLKIKCNMFKSPPSSNSSYVGASANTYIANTAKGYREPWDSRSPYINDGKGINAPDKDWLNLAYSTYEPSVLTLNFYPEKKDSPANIPNLTLIMHELLHLPGEQTTFSGFRFDNLTATAHNHLVTNDEKSKIETNEELQTLYSQRDRVYACSNLCSSSTDGAIKTTKEICLRCLSDSDSEDLTEDKEALEQCAGFN